VSLWPGKNEIWTGSGVAGARGSRPQQSEWSLDVKKMSAVTRTLIALPLVALLLPLTTSGFLVAQPQRLLADFHVMVSERPDRADAVRLDGALLASRPAYVFAVGPPADSVVEFRLDSPASPALPSGEQTIGSLSEDSGAAVPLDLAGLAGGYVLRAAAVKDGVAVVEASARFTVEGGSAAGGAVSAIEAPELEPFSLQVATAASRTPAVPLDGAVVTPTEAFVFAAGVPAGAEVAFSLSGDSGVTEHREKEAPYDLMGEADSIPRPLSERPGVVGVMTLVAQLIVAEELVDTVTARFSANGDPAAAVAAAAATPAAALPSVTPAVPKPPPARLAAGPAVPVIIGGDFPDSSTTGVPDGITLRPVGKVVVTEPGTTLNGLLIDCLDVKADNVTVVNSRIECGRDTYAVSNEGTNLVIRDSEVDGLGKGSTCVVHSRYTLERVDVTGCSDGLRANGDVVVRASLVHDLTRQPGSHNDTIQTTKGSNIVITGNTLLPYNSATDDPMNAGYILKEDQGPISNVTFVGNFVNGGNFSLYIIGTQDMSGLVFTDNTFGRDFRYGVVGGVPDAVEWRNNVFLDSGQPVR